MCQISWRTRVQREFNSFLLIIFLSDAKLFCHVICIPLRARTAQSPDEKLRHPATVIICDNIGQRVPLPEVWMMMMKILNSIGYNDHFKNI
jgi:hypothetical protein